MTKTQPATQHRRGIAEALLTSSHVWAYLTLLILYGLLALLGFTGALENNKWIAYSLYALAAISYGGLLYQHVRHKRKHIAEHPHEQ